LEWPHTATSLPQHIDPAAATEEQKTAWEHARFLFGTRIQPPVAQSQELLRSISPTAIADGKSDHPQEQKEVILQQLTKDPYPPHPPDLTYVRIMQCSTAVAQQCLDRNVFASNHRADIDGIDPGCTLIILINFDRHIVYGCYRAIEVGRMLDTSFASDRIHHVRVEPVHVFSPLPSYLLEAFLPRKYENGKPMRFYDKGTPNVKELWHLMQLYSNKGFTC
jgi:hypothetical protein